MHGETVKKRIIEFSEKLIAYMKPLSRVYLSNSGSEANEKAYKMVRLRAHNMGKPEKKKDAVKPENIFAEMIKNQPLMLTYPISKPVAKKDKKGNYRDAKGRIIAKANIGQYDLIAA